MKNDWKWIYGDEYCLKQYKYPRLAVCLCYLVLAILGIGFAIFSCWAGPILDKGLWSK
jgi:hypothetical protein